MQQNLLLLVGLNLALLLTLCAGLAYVAHKCRRVYLKLFEADRTSGERIDNLFTQLEALRALDQELALPMPLPPTRGWAGSPDFLRHVHRVARQWQPGCIVECSSGTSTVVLARTVQMNGGGHVYSLEHDAAYAEKTRQELQRQGLQAFATVIDAPLREHQLATGTWRWYDLAGLPSTIDLLVIDGPPMATQALARYPALPLLHDRLTPVARVILDDASRSDEREAVGRWTSEFNLTHDLELFAEKGIAVLKSVDARSAPV